MVFCLNVFGVGMSLAGLWVVDGGAGSSGCSVTGLSLLR